jgi:hypothetical protein
MKLIMLFELCLTVAKHEWISQQSDYDMGFATEEFGFGSRRDRDSSLHRGVEAGSGVSQIFHSAHTGGSLPGAKCPESGAAVKNHLF